MELTLDTDGGKHYIRHYIPGEIQLSDKTITDSCIISPTQLIAPWEPRDIRALTSEHIKQLAQLNPAVVILGTGPSLQFPTAAILAPLINKNIGAEVMDTAAACRTFNVLLSEGRNVVAGLLLA